MKLQIFDFDGTLVYSPLRNTFLKVKGLGSGTALQLYDKWLSQNRKSKRRWTGWFGRRETLLHPIFPRPLRDDMLNREIADLFIKSKNDLNVLTWMMTGRHTGIAQQVIDILMGYGLVDKVDLATRVECLFAKRTPTIDWKKDEILAAAFDRGITEIEIWEDRDEHIEILEKFGQTDLAELDCKLTIFKVE
tara:strand:- start:3195 stop:3767 length:573 start_codon:yes stop_codon:yes gene_type:complete